jgi:hypothetical protein
MRVTREADGFVRERCLEQPGLMSCHDVILRTGS